MSLGIQRASRLGTGTLSAAMAVQVFGAALAYGSQIVLANWLGVSNFGVYSATVSAVLIVSLLATFGTTSAALRLVPLALRGDSNRPASAVIGATATTSLVGAALGAASGYGVLVLFKDSSAAFAAATAAAIASSTLVHFGSDVGRSVGLNLTTYGAAVALRPALLTGLVLTLAMLEVNRDAGTALWMFAAATFGCLVVQLIAIAKSVTPNTLRPRKPSRSFLRRSIPFSLAATLTLTLTQVDLLVVAAVLPAADLGTYAACARVAAGIGMAAVAVNSVLAPKVAAAHLPREARSLSVTARRAARWSLVGAAALGLPIALLARQVLGFFGSDFVGGAWALVALVIGQLVATACGPAGIVLMFSDHERVAMTMFTATVVLSGGAAGVGASVSGPVGAAIGSALAMSTGGVVATLLAYRYTRVRTLPW